MNNILVLQCSQNYPVEIVRCLRNYYYYNQKGTTIDTTPSCIKPKLKDTCIRIDHMRHM